MSADVDRWVVAYVTPVVVENEKRAILHYEHGLDFYQSALNRGLEPDASRYLLAINPHGLIVSDSRSAINIDMVNGSDEPGTYFTPFELAGLSIAEVIARVDQGERIDDSLGKQIRVAYRRIEDWVLIAIDAT